jgi:hypothetical protein
MTAEHHQQDDRCRPDEGRREVVRELGGPLPFWRIDRGGEKILLRDIDGPPLATLHGMYAPGLADYLEAMPKTAMYSLAELLWTIGGHGDPARIRHCAFNLLRSMRVEERRTPGRRR